MTRAGLADVSTSALERLRDAIDSRSLDTPLTRSSLVSFGIRNQLDALSAALAGHSRLACLAVLDVTLAERAKHDRPAPELVWTGPEGHGAAARDTAIVLRELFESAREHVVLAGYSFTHAKSVLAPLHWAMKAHDVRATFFVDITQPPVATDPPERHAEDALADFLDANWPFGPPYPALYYDKRAIVPPPPFSILHAKCVVVDSARAFVSSANFTMQGQERNIEVGVLLHDARFAGHLARQWLALIDAGLVFEHRPAADATCAARRTRSAEERSSERPRALSCSPSDRASHSTQTRSPKRNGAESKENGHASAPPSRVAPRA